MSSYIYLSISKGGLDEEFGFSVQKQAITTPSAVLYQSVSPECSLLVTGSVPGAGGLSSLLSSLICRMLEIIFNRAISSRQPAQSKLTLGKTQVKVRRDLLSV